MLDIAYIRENADMVKKAAADKLINTDIDMLLYLDEQLRTLTREVDGFRARRNELSDKVKAAEGEEREAYKSEVVGIKERLTQLTRRQDRLKDEYTRLMLTVPSVPATEVPVGAKEEDNVEIRRWGEIPKFDFLPKNHIQLAEDLNLVDIPRAVKMAGSRSYFLKNEGLLLEMAVCRFTLDMLIRKGFTPMSAPVMVKERAMTGTGYFPAGFDQSYKLPEDELFLIGTSEVPLASYHSGEILSRAELPKRYAGYTTCFRREAGTYGKDTHGLYRVHQFQKVEQVIVCEADAHAAEVYHYEILNNTEEVLRALELPYRVAIACTGEMGIGQVRKHEVETWMPSRGAYCETHSCSTMGDFQSRRSNIKYRDGSNLRYCYTLNNTGIASPRILIPLLEINQLEDGSVRIPKVLVPYMGGMEVIQRRVDMNEGS